MRVNPRGKMHRESTRSNKQDVFQNYGGLRVRHAIEGTRNFKNRQKNLQTSQRPWGQKKQLAGPPGKRQRESTNRNKPDAFKIKVDYALNTRQNG